MPNSTKCSYWLIGRIPPLYTNLPGTKIIISRPFNEEGLRATWGGWESRIPDGHCGPGLIPTLPPEGYSLTTKAKDLPWLASAPSPQSSPGGTGAASCSLPTVLLTEDQPFLGQKEPTVKRKNDQVGTGYYSPVMLGLCAPIALKPHFLEWSTFFLVTQTNYLTFHDMGSLHSQESRELWGGEKVACFYRK